MSFEWLPGNMILYNGRVLQAGPGEWGAVDAIEAFEAEEDRRIREKIEREKFNGKHKAYFELERERDYYKRLADGHMKLNKQFEDALDQIYEIATRTNGPGPEEIKSIIRKVKDPNT